jgi:hypothetical protein
LASLVRGTTSESGLGNADLLANIARIAVWAFAIVVAVNQIGIATELVNTLFMASVGALALALGLAFGLGGREAAAHIWQSWYDTGQRAAPKMARAAEAAQEQAPAAAQPQSQSASSNRAERQPDQRVVVGPRRS